MRTFFSACIIVWFSRPSKTDGLVQRFWRQRPVFQVHFWVQAKNIAQMRMIETGVRLRIDSMFREADIVIAFPQRDLHIQIPNPIDLRIVGSGPTADEIDRLIRDAA